MTRLTTQQVLKDKHTKDPDSITSLSLTHKALSDVSCLSEFSNLERLDLAFNNLTSLQGLGSCVNLKWLSVVQNKLQSLKGIESLSKLTVLNAGKNKLKSIDDVKSMVSLRALILNDNEIVSICKLDQLKELNTLVLSRNPIRKIGESLAKVKSLSKLSLSNCQIENIDSSLKSCIELKELRIAHNDIKILPADLSYNKKLQILDLGNNVVTSWSDMKVLKSLVDLKNLNLQGNPVAENDKLAKKVQKVLPNLHVLNARPLDKGTKKSSKHEVDQRESKDLDDFSELDMDKGFEQKKKEDRTIVRNDDSMIQKKLKRKGSQEHDENNDLDMEELKQKRKKTKDKVYEDDTTATDKKPKKSRESRETLNELDIIDNAEASFADLFAVDALESPKHGSQKKTADKVVQGINSQSGLVSVTMKKKKSSKHAVGTTVQLPSAVEVGTGGPSTWGDE